jgi:K+ transporter
MPPLVLTRALEGLGTLHERVILVKERVSRIRQRVVLERRKSDVYMAQLHHGFMQAPDVPPAPHVAKFEGGPIELDKVTISLLIMLISPPET